MPIHADYYYCVLNRLHVEIFHRRFLACSRFVHLCILATYVLFLLLTTLYTHKKKQNCRE